MTIRRRFSGRKNVRKKIKLKVGVKNFGPISKGEIELRPLTILIGPNNSGKSYFAMLINSIFKSYSEVYFPVVFRPLLRTRPNSKVIDINKFVEEFSELKKFINDLIEGKEIEIPKHSIDKVINKIIETTYEKGLGNEISRSYASPIKELRMIGKRLFKLSINFNSYNIQLKYQRNKLKIEEYPHLNIKVLVKLIDIPVYRSNIEVKGKKIFIQISKRLIKRRLDKEFILFRLIESIFEGCSSYILKDVTKLCYYLPAARSGILQSHKALAASIVKKAPYVGIERIEIPKLSGVVSDFISSVIMLPGGKGHFYKLAHDFEEELIKGEIVVRLLEENISEIKYNFKNTEIPFHRASSTVSELAPIILYLKYFIEPEDILIIEEPEAHLHPENQRILAKFLVRLIRKGVNILITTHSECLLEQLSSFILLSKIESEKRVEKYKYNKEDYLKSNEIATYVFNYDKRSGGHKIVEVETTEEDGISQEEFIKIHEILYEETYKLRKELSSET